MAGITELGLTALMQWNPSPGAQTSVSRQRHTKGEVKVNFLDRERLKLYFTYTSEKMHKGTYYESLHKGKRTNRIIRYMPIANIQGVP